MRFSGCLVAPRQRRTVEESSAEGLWRKARSPAFPQSKVQQYRSVTLLKVSEAGCEGRTFLLAFFFGLNGIEHLSFFLLVLRCCFNKAITESGISCTSAAVLSCRLLINISSGTEHTDKDAKGSLGHRQRFLLLSTVILNAKYCCNTRPSTGIPVIQGTVRF